MWRPVGKPRGSRTARVVTESPGFGQEAEPGSAVRERLSCVSVGQHGARHRTRLQKVFVGDSL